MYNYNSQSQTFANSISAPVDSANGLQFVAGQTQSISSVKITEQMAVGVQVWFKGAMAAGSKFASVSKDSANKSVYLERSGADIVMKTTYSSTVSVTFSGAATNLDPANWIFIGMSVGWMARNRDFMMWGYIYQASTNYEFGAWSSTFTVPLAEFQSGSIFSIDFGPGLDGYLKQVYVGNHLEHSSVFRLFRDSFSGPRYFWFDTSKHSDPHYFKNWMRQWVCFALWNIGAVRRRKCDWYWRLTDNMLSPVFIQMSPLGRNRRLWSLLFSLRW